MVRKVVCTCVAAAVLMCLGVRANAAELGSVRVSLDMGEMPVTNGSITLYQVGTPGEEGYRIMEDFGGGIVKLEDATSSNLAQWLAETAEVEGRTIYLDVDGNVTFSNLKKGLYLVVQRECTDGFYPLKPTLIALPDENQWDAKIQRTAEPIIAENPQTGQQPWPLLAAMGMVGSGVGIYFCIDSRRKK